MEIGTKATYMNHGRAQKWVNRVYYWEATPANIGSPHFIDWDDFRDLISESRYSDPKTVVVKFQRGLNPTIADAVATMASGKTDDLYPDAWYEAAIRIDQNQAANAAFRLAHYPTVQSKISAATPVNQNQLNQPNHPHFPSWFAHTAPTPGNPVPMDVDAARRAAKTQPTCFHCGKLGHIVPDCPQGLDVRSMSRDEVDILMEQLYAQIDKINLSTSTLASDEVEVPTETEITTVDFPRGGR